MDPLRDHGHAAHPELVRGDFATLGGITDDLIVERFGVGAALDGQLDLLQIDHNSQMGDQDLQIHLDSVRIGLLHHLGDPIECSTGDRILERLDGITWGLG